MSTKNYTTKTARLRATNIDTNKIELKGRNILDYIADAKTIVKDDREVITENDLWGTSVTIGEDGVVTVSDKYITNPNTSGGAWYNSVTKVEDNKAYNASGFYANVQTDKIVDGAGFCRACYSLTHFSSPLTSLTNGGSMFYACNSLTSFSTPLTSLTNGGGMFRDCYNLSSFSSPLTSLTNGDGMFERCYKLASFRGYLGSLTNGSNMFTNCSQLASFISPLNSLTNGTSMFSGCYNLTSFVASFGSSFNTSLPSLTDGSSMFSGCSKLTSFDTSLTSLTNGDGMFERCSKLASFSSSLSSLTNGYQMFYYCSSLTSFNTPLNSLTNGRYMFKGCPELSSFSSPLPSLTDGIHMFVGCSQLSSFSSSLTSLTNGERMHYGNTALTNYQANLDSLLTGYEMFIGTKLSPESFMYIADSIRDLAAEGLVSSSDGGKTWTVVSNAIWDKSGISSSYRAKIHLGYDSTAHPSGSEGETEIFGLCNEIAAKGWTVYLNGSSTAYVPNDAVASTSLEGGITETPISYWYKPVSVTEDEAEYTNENGEFFIIVGGQYIFGDDITTYGQFVSLTEAESAMGFTPYVKPATEEEEEEEVK